MDFQSAMETFAEAWVAANSKSSPLADLTTQSQALALTRNCKSPSTQNGGGGVGATTGSNNNGSGENGERRGMNNGEVPERRTPTTPEERNATPMDAVSPPSVKEEFENGGKTLAKSLPVHCVVEAVCSLEDTRSSINSNSNSWRRRTLVETDSFVIIPVSTPFHDLVQAALLQLGYSPESVAAAKGAVVIKNWKALTFDQISDDPIASVGEILGELTSVATLRIQVFRGRPGAVTDIKDKLLRFLMVQSHGVLMSSGCPLDEVLLSQICRGGAGNTPPEMTEESRKKFDQWWSAQFSPQSPSRPHLAPPCQFPTSAPHPAKLLERTSLHPDPVGHPALQTVHNQFPTQKTRMRTSFDPELELPKLQRWFADNQHPSRQQIQQYVKELNSLQSRRGRKPLDVNNVVYWFKNARAAQKRAETRQVGHLVNGYNNYSPTNGSGFLMNDGYLPSERMDGWRKGACRRGPNTSHMSDEFSNTGSDLDEEDMTEPPGSPVGPLSLTTRKTESRDGSPRSSTPIPDQIEPKIEPKCDEPINYHSSSDHSNNNKVHSISDNGDPDPDAAEEPDSEPETKGNYDMMTHMMRPRSCDSPTEPHPLSGHRVPNEGLERLAASFPLVPNSMFSHSIMYMSQYIPGLQHAAAGSPPGASSALTMSALSADERRKRNRTFIDPVTEVPRLEQWFSLNTHPSHNLILKYTEELNCMAYRQKFPRLEPKNVQFWFKNRRAKCKRLKMSLFDSQGGHFGDKE